MDDYHIIIETANCTMESLSKNEIECRPPIYAPAKDPRLSNTTLTTLQCHQTNSLHVLVS